MTWKTFVLLFIFLPLEASAWDGFLYVKSSKDLLVEIRQQELLNEYQEACKKEDRQGTFPFHCVLRLKARALNFPNGLKWKKQWASLSRKCVRTAQTLGDTEQIETFLSEKEFSSECLQALRSRKLDIIYIEEGAFGK